MKTKVKSLFEHYPNLKAVAAEKERPILHSVYWNGVRLIATNGYQLALVTPKNRPDNIWSWADYSPVIIPLQALADPECRLDIVGDTIIVENSDYMRVTYQLFGTYPDVDQIVPTSKPDKWAEFDARELFDLGLYDTSYVHLIVNKDENWGQVSALDDRSKQGKVKVTCNGSFSVAIDSKRLLDLAKAIMLPVKVKRKDTYPIRLYAQMREYGPCQVESTVPHVYFESFGVIMPMYR